MPDTVIAFRLVFPTSELAVCPEQRVGREWKKVIFIESARQGKLAMVTVFVTVGPLMLKHGSEPSFCLASLRIGERYAQIIAHEDPEGEFPQVVEQSVAEARRQMKSARVGIPTASYGYFFGHLSDGSRFLVGACMNRATS